MHPVEALRRHRPYRNQELAWRRPDGELRFLRHSGKPIFDANARFGGYRGTATDITEQKAAEGALRDSEQRLMEQQRREKMSVERQLAEVQDELVRHTRFAAIGQVAASIAHDLRNPLGAIRNAKFYLSRRVPGDKPKWREYLGIIEQEVVSADRIINELMDMSRARAPERLTAIRTASPTASASTMAFSFTEFSGVGCAAYDSTR